MPRLTPPTRTTFGAALVLIVAGIALSPQVGVVDGGGDLGFLLLAAGAVVLVAGVLLRRL